MHIVKGSNFIHLLIVLYNVLKISVTFVSLSLHLSRAVSPEKYNLELKFYTGIYRLNKNGFPDISTENTISRREMSSRFFEISILISAA